MCHSDGGIHEKVRGYLKENITQGFRLATSRKV